MVGVVLVVKYTNIVVRTVDFVLLKRLVIPKVCQSYPYLAIGGLPDMCAVYIYSINWCSVFCVRVHMPNIVFYLVHVWAAVIFEFFQKF